MTVTSTKTDPKLDLVLQRFIDVPAELVWRAWTEPEHIKQWIAPKPWSTVDCEVDLRPGGAFRFVMKSPEGQEFPNLVCYLEIVEGERLVWTDALEPGFRPATSEDAPFTFTAKIILERKGNGTKYTAIAMHKDETGRTKHEEMGFHEGWSQVLDQLVAHAKTM